MTKDQFAYLLQQILVYGKPMDPVLAGAIYDAIYPLLKDKTQDWIDFEDKTPLPLETIDVLLQHVDNKGTKRLTRMTNLTWSDRHNSVMDYSSGGLGMLVPNAVYWKPIDMGMPVK